MGIIGKAYRKLMKFGVIYVFNLLVYFKLVTNKLRFIDFSRYWKIHDMAEEWQRFFLSTWQVQAFEWRRVNKGETVYCRQDGIYHAIRVSCYRSSRVRVTECNSGYSSTSAAETNLVKLVLCETETQENLSKHFCRNIYFYKWEDHGHARHFLNCIYNRAPITRISKPIFHLWDIVI